MRGKQAFTLVELLTVIAIIAILYAIFFPVFIAVKSAALAYSATSNLSQLGTAASLYSADHDDRMMPCSYNAPNGLQLWFGLRGADGTIDVTQALARAYMTGKVLGDPTFQPKAWLGDKSGFGYNWGYIGSDFHITNDLRGFPNAQNPASVSELEQPSGTILFATSSYYFAPWLPNGDSQTYDFSFISAPRFWGGNPDMDFRHQGKKTVVQAEHSVTSTGNALVLFADGHTKPKKQDTIKDEMFQRTPRLQ